MRVSPNMWDPPSCEGLLYSCCIGVVNLTFFYVKTTFCGACPDASHNCLNASHKNSKKRKKEKKKKKEK
jgi:hypothetical protein